MEAGAGSRLVKHRSVINRKPYRVYRPIKHRSVMTTALRLDLGLLKCPNAPRKSKAPSRRPKLQSLLCTEEL